MSTTHELTWGSLSVLLNERERPSVRLHAYTASEQARVIELDKRQLVQLLVDASSALSTIESWERQQLSPPAGVGARCPHGQPQGWTCSDCGGPAKVSRL